MVPVVEQQTKAVMSGLADPLFRAHSLNISENPSLIHVVNVTSFKIHATEGRFKGGVEKGQPLLFF